MTEAQAILRQGLATLGEGEPAAPALLELEIAWTQHRRGQVRGPAHPGTGGDFFADAGDQPRAALARPADHEPVRSRSRDRGAPALDRAQAANGGKANHQCGILRLVGL
jgi:hypothetical protein